MKPNMNQNNGLAHVERLRQWRVRSPQLELADAFRRAGVEYQAAARVGLTVGQAWASLAPGGLGARAMADRVSRGVLVVRVANSADQHEAARWLRGGGALELSRAAGVGIRRWRFEYGPVSAG